MPHPASLLTEGFQLHSAGKLAEAAEKYRQVLADAPDNADARALLGAACLSLNRHDEAVAHLQQALTLDPQHAGACDNLGVALAKLGRLPEAVVQLRWAVRLRPHQAETLGNLGKALVMQGELEEAVATLTEAVKRKADSPVLHFHLAQAFNRLGRVAEAAATYRKVLDLKPDHTTAMVNLGSVLCDLGEMDEAERVLRTTLRLNSTLSPAWNNLGSVFIRQYRFDEAAEVLRQAIVLAPNDADPHYNLGFTLLKQCRQHEALESFTRAIELNPEYAKAHFNRSVTWLLLGDFERGWPEYEWRWQCKEFTPRSFQEPRWDGAPLHGRTILLFAEQGLGDTLQFIRYAAQVKVSGGHVIVECPPPLAPLLARTPGVDQVIPAGSPLPGFDVQAPLMGLPLILRTDLTTIPREVPYVRPDPAWIERWQGKVQQHREFRVGIAWQGNPRYRDDRLRSIPLHQFEPLARLKGIRLFSLQRGPGVDQLKDLPSGFTVVDLGAGSGDATWTFMDTAAVMCHLDVVICCDTVVAHLAGGLGIPVWLLLPVAPDWRWLLEREDSPWYPSMRLFRQTAEGDWVGVINRVADELRTAVRHRG